MSKILITGGTGSFGTAMLTNLLKDDSIEEVRIFSRDEKKQDDMRTKFKDKRVRYFIGDVRVMPSIERAMQGVDAVFHASAMKQVPSCEEFPIEAMNTNIMGSANVLSLAMGFHIPKVVVLSTDKAVMPVNTMGMTKALMEKIALDTALRIEETGTNVCVTRYGNVMGSRGSVIPRFAEQIDNGKDVTITDSKMTRFMMNLSEAVELVKFALYHGENGTTYVMKSPASTVKDIFLAISTMKGYTNYPFVEEGPRAGEKTHETLVSSEEMTRSFDCGLYYAVPPLDSCHYTVPRPAYTSDTTKRLTLEETISIIREGGVI